MEFTKKENLIIQNALVSRKLKLEHFLNDNTLPVSINRIFNEELSSISSLILRFSDELNKDIIAVYNGD